MYFPISDKAVKMPKRLAKSNPPRAEQNCIIHYKDIKWTKFTKLSDLRDADERFQSICEVRDIRETQPADSVNRQQHICDQIPVQYDGSQGYHRECYQRFTMNIKRMKPTAGASNYQPKKRTRRSSSADGKDKILFKQDCIFCGKEGRKKFL